MQSLGPAETPVDQYERCAQYISGADYLLIATGAGMSASSGLPVYADIANVDAYRELGLTYSDLCRIDLLDREPDLFYGFWGKCYNMYKETPPHAGYGILAQWCRQVGNRADRSGKTDANQLAEDFQRHYIYTSNVDGHHRATLPPPLYSNILEIHGNVNKWVCDDPERRVVQPAEDFRFAVGEGEVRLPEEAAAAGLLPSSAGCLRCRPRPAVVMFDDATTEAVPGLGEAMARYQAWEARVEAAAAAAPPGGGPSLVIIEVGCGTRVPSVRIECEDVLQDTLAACARQGSASSGPATSAPAVLIRINPEDTGPPRLPEHTVVVKEQALHALRGIDAALRGMTPGETKKQRPPWKEIGRRFYESMVADGTYEGPQYENFSKWLNQEKVVNPKKIGNART